MFQDKIKNRQTGLLLYGITPPKEGTEDIKLSEIAKSTLERLHHIDIDALVVYDVQDEASRTTEERPFAFLKSLDPMVYSDNYLGSLDVPKIIYRPVGAFSNEEITNWSVEVNQKGYSPVFVGMPSPDFVPVTTLPEAYNIYKNNRQGSALGAVAIPERHALLGDEPTRILAKMDQGVDFFITQCIFNVDYAKQMIADLEQTCTTQGRELPTIIFTLTACGSKKTLKFIEWLGIHIPENVKTEMLAQKDILKHSVDLCIRIAKELTEFCTSKNIPFGFNIESVAIRKEEIEASVKMAQNIGGGLKFLGIR